MVNKIIETVFGSKHERDLKELLPVLHKVNEKEKWAMGLNNDELKSQTALFRERIKNNESLDDILPEAFAVVREAARRTLGERPYDVQILGGIVLHQGKITEMKTGEGKTLSSVTAAYLNALSGRGVHIVTVNDYLAERDALWMKPVYDLLDISVGFIVSNMDNEVRKQAYLNDITYGTNNELGFDYLRDNMRWNSEDKVLRHHNYCIIDEIDSILIDEARTPLIISGAAEDDTRKFYEVNNLVSLLKECEKDENTGEYPDENPVGDFKIDEKGKRVTFTEEGINSVERLLIKNGIIKESLYNEDNFEYIHYITQALKAHKLFHKDVDYVVQGGLVQIVDEFTGRILAGRRYSEGLHQAIEAKEKIKVAQRNKTLATITFQNFFRMYDKISGMTGTADTEAREFARIYNLDVVVIPTNRPINRDDQDDEIYLNENCKFDAICEEIETAHKKGQPILVGTVSIEKSELLSKLLTQKGIRHEVLNAKNHAREAMIIAEAGAGGSVTIATNMAGRGTDIKLGGNPEFRARKAAGTEAEEEVFKKAYRKEYEKWLTEYEQVKAAGGLFVLGTERHESRRIDNQLRGRSGRQGDPGRSKFYISLDDTLMRLFGGENMKSLMSKAGMKNDEPIHHPWISKSIEKAQKRVEERNYDIRKHLLEYDDVLNEHRKFIYNQRDTILEEENLSERIISIAEECLDDILLETEKTHNTNSYFLDKIQEVLFYRPQVSQDSINDMPLNELKDYIVRQIAAETLEKEAQVGKENFNYFIRIEYMRHIDTKWQEHLENLEELREAVYLRTYGQKNPLLEYKLEGFEIFDKLISEIRLMLTRKVLNVRIRTAEGDKPKNMPRESVHASHNAMGQFSGNAQQSAAGMPDNVQVKRSVPKVGRNDMCPCGSGKKYKHCHGR
ncbi:MAG: preprotein translocase subunit SecA [Spirochaetia bacterium]|jgi:preprotein translocase subunit SecA|nr:preprotein translocase subunit SecA [Spirochaetia bacterium]